MSYVVNRTVVCLSVHSRYVSDGWTKGGFHRFCPSDCTAHKNTKYVNPCKWKFENCKKNTNQQPFNWTFA